MTNDAYQDPKAPAFRDGTCIDLPDGYREVPRHTSRARYLNIGRTDHFFFKQPTDRYYQKIPKYFRGLFCRGRFGIASAWLFGYRGAFPIRWQAYEESPKHIGCLQMLFPELLNATQDPMALHFLMLHKLQYQRLLGVCKRGIPMTSFVSISRPEGVKPAIVQSAIHGVSLEDMIEKTPGIRWVGNFRLLPQWREAGRAIADQLMCYLSSEHVDCNATNFIFSPKTDTLYYVDSEPTFIRTRRMNDVHKIRLRALISSSRNP